MPKPRKDSKTLSVIVLPRGEARDLRERLVGVEDVAKSPMVNVVNGPNVRAANASRNVNAKENTRNRYFD
jgi:hypothetical protein